MAVRNAEEAKLKETFEQVVAQLKKPEFQARHPHALAYWVQKADRRLPLAFLDRTVGEIIHTSYYILVASAGIGPKKMQCLTRLLRRVVTHEAPASSPNSGDISQPKVNANSLTFDPDHVSELEWEHWRKTVRLFGLEGEKLGRIAPSLSRIPSVIWHTPLSFYLDQSLEEIRQLRTYGRKRVTVVAEVFHTVHNLFRDGVPNPYFAVRLVPRFVLPIETWATAVIQENRLPQPTEVFAEVIEPMLAQVLEDAGEIVSSLARTKLDASCDQITVRQQSKELKVTRARIYQMREECQLVLEVRWPEGRCVLRQLLDHVVRLDSNHPTAALLERLSSFVYPERFDPVQKHLVSKQA